MLKMLFNAWLVHRLAFVFYLVHCKVKQIIIIIIITDVGGSIVKGITDEILNWQHDFRINDTFIEKIYR